MLLLTTIVLVCAAILPAHADDYPSRNVTVIVPYAPGGATDAVTRLVGQRLEQRLGHAFVVEHRPGAGSVIGASYVAKAAPDGYTLMDATSTTMAINVSIYKNLPYDPTRDLTPIAIVAGVPFMLVVNPDLPVRSVADLVTLAKSKPLPYASNGHGSAGNLYAELLKSLTGMPATEIPYKGNSPALNDVIAGHVPWMFGDFSTALPLARAGKLRALGVSTAQRVGAAPEIPALAEVGVPGFDASAWQMIVAPGATPKAIVNKLNGELHAIVADAEIQKEFSDRGYVPLVSPSPQELEAYVKSEIVRWGKVVQQAGAAGTQ
jgi:tripartite-type tricarboxylate transporter receptor subunit TctC